ncbi:MAG: hypothetical protein AAFR00_00175 [Pseudomonadota bacterium]
MDLLVLLLLVLMAGPLLGRFGSRALPSTGRLPVGAAIAVGGAASGVVRAIQSAKVGARQGVAVPGFGLAAANPGRNAIRLGGRAGRFAIITRRAGSCCRPRTIHRRLI